MFRAVRRDDLMAAVDAAIGGGARVILLAGPAGIGKSFVLETLAAAVERRGDRVDRVWGTAALSDVPGGALAHLVAPSADIATMLAGLVRNVAPILCVDDLDQCDPLSVAMLERLAREPGRLTLATMRSENGLPPDRIRDFVDRSAARIVVVGPLVARQVSELVTGVLDDEVHGDLVDEVWRRTGGNPLYATQLLLSARETGAIARRGGLWVVDGPLGAPASLRAALLARLDGLGPAACDAAEFLAAMGETRLDRVESSGRAVGSRELLQAGVATIHGERIALAHPLFAEAVTSRTDPLRRRELLREHFAAERSSKFPDQVRLALLAIQIDEDVPAGALVRAARLAMAGADTRTALVLALAALQTARGDIRIEALGFAADAQMQLGRGAEARDLLEQALGRTAPGPRALLLTALLHVVLTWGCHDPSASAEMLAAQVKRYPRWTPVVGELFAVLESDRLVYEGRPASALAVLEGGSAGGHGTDLIGRIAAATRFAPHLEARMATARAQALIQLGRAEEALAALDVDVFTARAELLDEQVPSWRADVENARAHALRDLDPERARVVGEGAYRTADDLGLVQAKAWAAFMQSGAALFAGRLDDAAEWARRARALAESGGMPACRRLADAYLDIATGSRGLIEPRADGGAEPAPAATGFLWHQTLIGDAWRARASGRLARAARIMAEAHAAAAGDGALMSVAFIAHERVRMGERGVSSVLAELPGAGPLLVARRLLARGVDENDAGLLHRAADAFERLGMPLFAAEALAVAAGEQSGRARAAAQHRASLLAEAAGSPATPLLARASARPVLTPREQDIAERAIVRTSSEIASELYLSVRTVDTHLGRVYTKLGISSRRDLAEALGVSD
ncbi:LuxR family transcriptional regulator [Agromyces protaetiae]|uniref:LuxR family transcriptional regulator n=1 Tax=Agromyces protaetiae TaxID=2509455 RepID=A0A4V0YHB7_9MICO|nr:LuxR family transcriptional regulator [Agromyces protaetiae]QAY74151.1 LuxR family transcriptional regulator [Agromyces protaetiae]